MRLTLSFFLIAMLAAYSSQAQTIKARRGPKEKVDLNAIPDSSYYAGELYFKFKPGFEPFLKKDIAKNAKGELSFGISQLDRLLENVARRARGGLHPGLP